MTSNSFGLALTEQTAVTEKIEPAWRWLYKLGSVAALASPFPFYPFYFTGSGTS